MTTLAARSSRPTPSDRDVRRPRDDVLSLAERSRHLVVLRLALASIVGASVVVWPAMLVGPAAPLIVATALYVVIAVIVAGVAAWWPARRVTLPVLQGALLVDGVFLVTAVIFTGGNESVLRSLVAAHLVAATLLCSYRTGLKIALWDTLLIVLALRAIGLEVIPVDPPVADGIGSSASSIAGLWVIALTTAACAAASERILRTQRADLASLTTMAARIEERPNAADIPIVLLDELCAMFRFRRGMVLIGSGAELAVGAATDGVGPVGARIDLGVTMTAVRGERAPRLLRAIHPGKDGWLASVLPGGRNVVCLPLLAPRGPCLGVVVLERGGHGTGIARWTIAMMERFVAHAALALVNARLTDERDAQLATIHGLEQHLRAYNAELEERVAARTIELRETVAILRETDTQRRRLLDHVVRAAEEERRKIANDVHDDPVQKLIALKMRLELLAAKHPDAADVGEAKGAVEGVLHSMRHLLFDLRPPILDEAGFDEAVRYLLEQSALPFAWSVEGSVDPEPSEQARVILYRIAQEAVANARKHSHADHLSVRLADRDGGTWMEIEDDGVGFLPQEAVVAAPGHLGLAAMRERAEMAGGRCELRSLPGGGTTLGVWLPSTPTSDVMEHLDVAAVESDSSWRQTRAS
jgi:signal transduction histidine kinase